MQKNFLKKWLWIYILFFMTHSCVHSEKIYPLKEIQKGHTFTKGGDYILSDGDRIAIIVLGQQDLSNTYTISESGQLNLPLIGFTTARGYTLKALLNKLKKQLDPFVQRPTITGSIEEYNSYKVYFSGEIANPGMYQYNSKTTILQGIARAGGLGRFASGEIVVVRNQDDKGIQRYSADYELIMDGVGKLDSIILERGDIIIVK